MKVMLLMMVIIVLGLSVSACGAEGALAPVKKVCVEGLAFARVGGSQGDIERVPEWDETC